MIGAGLDGIATAARLARHREQIKDIFAAMFKNNRAERVFRLLDEEALLWENVQLIATLPPGLFLETLCQKRVWRALGKSSLTTRSTRRGKTTAGALALDRQTQRIVRLRTSRGFDDFLSA